MRTRLQSKNQNVSEDRWVVDVNNLNMDGDFCRIGWINTYALFWFIASLLFDTAWWFPGAIINGQSWYKCVLYSASTFMCNDCWRLNIQASTTVKVIVKDHFQKLCDSQIWYMAAVAYSDGLLFNQKLPYSITSGAESLYCVSFSSSRIDCRYLVPEKSWLLLTRTPKKPQINFYSQLFIFHSYRYLCRTIEVLYIRYSYICLFFLAYTDWLQSYRTPV